jgi:hypothetical protein
VDWPGSVELPAVSTLSPLKEVAIELAMVRDAGDE